MTYGIPILLFEKKERRQNQMVEKEGQIMIRKAIMGTSTTRLAITVEMVDGDGGDRLGFLENLLPEAWGWLEWPGHVHLVQASFSNMFVPCLFRKSNIESLISNPFGLINWISEQMTEFYRTTPHIVVKHEDCHA